MKLTLMMLANNHHHHDDQCRISQDKLAEETEQSDRTIRTQLRRLEELGIIKRVRTFAERGERAADEFILVGLTRHSEEEIQARARGRLSKPYRKDLPVGKASEPSGNMFPVGGADLPENEAEPTGKSGQPYRKTVSGTEEDSFRIPDKDREGRESESTCAREKLTLPEALNALSPEIGKATWKSWIEPLQIVSLDPPIIGAPSRFHAQRVRQDFGEKLERLLGNGTKLEITNTGARRALPEAKGAGR